MFVIKYDYQICLECDASSSHVKKNMCATIEYEHITSNESHHQKLLAEASVSLHPSDTNIEAKQLNISTAAVMIVWDE